MFVATAGATFAGTNYTRSPDDRIAAQIHVSDGRTYDVSRNTKLLMKDSALAINVDGKKYGESPQVMPRAGSIFCELRDLN